MPSSCGTCSKSNVTFFCSRCRDTYYCNVRCQRKNWKQHKTQCYRYKLNQDVALRVIKINGKVTWVDAEVTKLLPCSQYQITIDNFIFRTNPFIDKNIVIASENELRLGLYRFSWFFFELNNSVNCSHGFSELFTRIHLDQIWTRPSKLCFTSKCTVQRQS